LERLVAIVEEVAVAKDKVKSLTKSLEGGKEARTYSHDLNNVKSYKPYQTRMQKRIKRAGFPEGTVLDDLNDDSGEYASRIWKWWKGRRDKVKVHGLVLR
jgi:hypothetical protein